MFDRWTGRMKEVLGAQAFMNRYYPRWTDHGTLIVSYVCRKDSSYTIWEVDTNGVFLRQLTDRSLFDRFITSAEDVPGRNSVPMLRAHPQPASHSVTIRYQAGSGGTYSLSLVDLLGRELRRTDLSLHQPPFVGEITLGIEGVAPGAYLVRLAYHSRVEASRVILIGR